MSETSPTIALQFDEQGLLPCIVQDWVDGGVYEPGSVGSDLPVPTGSFLESITKTVMEEG
jgi:hypothetical protein